MLTEEFMYEDTDNKYDDFYYIINKIYQSLVDDKSRTIFLNRLAYSLAEDQQSMRKVIETADYYEEFYNELTKNTSDIYIYGAGKRGKRLVDMFPEIQWKALIDKSQRGNYHKCRIISMDDLQINTQTRVLISNLVGYDEIKNTLRESGLNENQIIVLRYFDNKFSENIYFDTSIIGQKLNIDKYFIDAGSYYGEDTLRYIKLFLKEKDTNVKAIAFEPDKKNYNKCKENLSGYQFIDIRNTAMHNANDELYMDFDKGEMSKLVSLSDNMIMGEALDDIVGDRTVGFIKMDIEGSELNALQGAKKVISEQHPILAISIYHKKYDIWKLPNYILEINENYKLYLRHYNASCGETVLYAIP